MNTAEKRTLTHLNKIPMFNIVIHKLSVGIELTDEEKSFVLSCAIVFIKHYERDHRLTSYAEFAYFIILKYSITYNDYRPLYDFSVNFGYYPISKAIFEMAVIESESLEQCFTDIEIEKFRNNNHVETLQQYNSKKNLIKDDTEEKSFVAPTSFGKSSVIAECIKKYNQATLKVCIIVPTKSLLMQTYRMIKDAQLGYKIIIHDEMYQNQDSFIAVFTQERALRLLSKHPIFFDLLFIDEAHNILSNDSRSILITRLLAKNRLLNRNNHIVYLSPLIDETNNLKINQEQSISQHKIAFNIKEPEIFEYCLDGQATKYNRFANEFYPIGHSPDIFSYILANAKEKNFVYNLRPSLIEKLAKELSERLPPLPPDSQINELIQILKHEVHEQFYAVEYIQKGIIYIHGKLPDIIKEYLESKFKDLKLVRFIVANHVILEGMNLPVDNLYILNVWKLYEKELTNLIGRVNRLNTIFKTGNHDLSKLLPSVHFVNSENYNRKNSNMSKKITLLRSSTFKDYIENPTLEAYEIDRLGLSGEKKRDKLIANQKILDGEEFLLTVPNNEGESLKKYMIENGISTFYEDIDSVVDIILQRLNFSGAMLTQYNILQKINHFFIEGIRGIKDFEFARLNNTQAQDYYEYHITVNLRRSLKENIIHLYRYFRKRAEDERYFYFGSTYGETEHPERENSAKTWVDLATKSQSELINLAIVKLKMEDDFVSFKLNKFIIMMHDYELISTNDYNLYIYGTTDQRKIDLTKFGLNISLISRLEKDNQLEYLYFDEYNNLKALPEFDAYKNRINDFYKFEIERFIL